MQKVKVPRRPDMLKDRDTWLDKYVSQKVQPRLQWLLDKAQQRMRRHALTYVSGMGTDFFVVDGEIHRQLTDEVTDAALDSGSIRRRRGPPRRFARQFPELVEFIELSLELDDVFRYDIGNMTPTEQK